MQLKASRDEVVSKAEKQDRAIATFHKYLSHENLSSAAPQGREGLKASEFKHVCLSETSL